MEVLVNILKASLEYIPAFLGGVICISIAHGKREAKRVAIEAEIEGCKVEIESIKDRLDNKDGGVVTHNSLTRRQAQCREVLNSDSGHLKETVKRIEDKLDKFIDEFRGT